MRWLVTVDLPWANFGLLVEPDGTVSWCAPISGWARGRRGRDVVAYWRGRGATVTWTRHDDDSAGIIDF